MFHCGSIDSQCWLFAVSGGAACRMLHLNPTWHLKACLAVKTHPLLPAYAGSAASLAYRSSQGRQRYASQWLQGIFHECVVVMSFSYNLVINGCLDVQSCLSPFNLLKINYFVG